MLIVITTCPFPNDPLEFHLLEMLQLDEKGLGICLKLSWPSLQTSNLPGWSKKSCLWVCFLGVASVPFIWVTLAILPPNSSHEVGCLPEGVEWSFTSCSGPATSIYTCSLVGDCGSWDGDKRRGKRDLLALPTFQEIVSPQKIRKRFLKPLSSSNSSALPIVDHLTELFSAVLPYGLLLVLFPLFLCISAHGLSGFRCPPGWDP